MEKRYRVPEWEEFGPGFKYEYETTTYELEGDMLAVYIEKKKWSKITIPDYGEDTEGYLGVLKLVYEHDKNRFRVRDYSGDRSVTVHE
jgi:hypothetical protein